MAAFQLGNYDPSQYQLGNPQTYNFGLGSDTGGTQISGLATDPNSFFNTGVDKLSGLNTSSVDPSQEAGVLGYNIPTAQLGLSGLSAIGNLWGAYQANKQASSQFDYTKKITDTNLANQTKTYNTALSDKATSRGSMEGWTDAQTQSYIDKNKL